MILLCCVDKFEPILCCGEMEHSEEAVGEFVVSSGGGTVDFEMTDHALDAVALAIEVLVPSDLDPACLEVGADGVTVIALVPEQVLSGMKCNTSRC